MNVSKTSAMLLLAASSALAQTSNPIRTADFVNSLGVNTHLDFGGYYNTLQLAEGAVNYLGLHNVRDSLGNSNAVQAWLPFANATGAKFDAYIGETSISGMSTELDYVPQAASEGILNFVEGGNEEDDSYPVSLGNSYSAAAAFQQQVHATAQSLYLPTINLSFGAGWTADNDWHGDYDKVGNLNAFTEFGNAHTYPITVNGAPDSAIQQVNFDARLAASARPVVTTELGWNQQQVIDGQRWDFTSIGKYVLDGALDGTKDGDVKTYFYGLYDDGSGAFGLMNADGSARPAGFALHNLTTLLADNAASAGFFQMAPLKYSFANLQSSDNVLTLQKSDGTYWLAVWNEAQAPHNVTLNLGSPASSILVFDPLNGTQPVQSASSTGTLTAAVPDHPILIEVAPTAGANSGVSPDKWYTIVHQPGDQCLDATGWGVANGTVVQQWVCGGGQSNQEWQFRPTNSGYYTIINRNAVAGQEVIDITNNSTANAQAIDLWPAWNGPNQQWLPVPIGNGQYKLVGRGSGRCLDVPFNSANSGTPVQSFDCNGSQAQAFQLIPRP